MPSSPRASLAGNEPLFMVMNSGSGKHDSSTTQEAIRTACSAAGRRCKLIMLNKARIYRRPPSKQCIWHNGTRVWWLRWEVTAR